MPSTVYETSIEIHNARGKLADANSVAIYFDQWLVQLVCTITTGAHNLTLGQSYTIRRNGGGDLANMFYDEGPAPSISAPSSLIAFEVGGGPARFSNHKRPGGGDRTYRPDQWKFGDSGEGGGEKKAKIDKNRLSFNTDEL